MSPKNVILQKNYITMFIPSLHFANLVFEKAAKRGKHNIVYYRDALLEKWLPITWNDLADRIMATAQALVHAGINEKDRVGICSQNMPQCLMVDFANFVNRAVSVPMYATLAASQIEYILNDAQISLLFVGEQLQYDKAVEAAEKAPTLQKIIVFDERVNLNNNPKAIYFNDFIKTGNTPNCAKIVTTRRSHAREDDLAIIMYTSGTTGEPKGVMLRHSSLIEAMRIHALRFKTLPKHATSLTFLPLSHIFERGWTYFCLCSDIKVYLNLHPADIQQITAEVHPNYMCSVPRYWEKVAIGVKQKIEQFSPFKKALVAWAVAVGHEYNIDHRRLSKRVGPQLWLRYRIAHDFIFSKLKRIVGIDRGIMFPVAGAAINNKLLTFFRSLGIPLCYGYGLSETTATVACFPFYNYTIGSVGTLMPDVQVRIGEDNEILVKGKTVMAGYYKRPDLTEQAFTDGWFHTGDAGKLEGDTLYMTERIKDLFKTSNGKYVSPQQIEMRLGSDPYIEQIAVIGNNRNFITAIVAPAIEPLKNFAQTHNIPYERIEDLLQHPQVLKFYQEHIDQGQQDLASFERIKKFRLIKRGFTVESGELTSTLKLRRAVILQNYATLIDEMYAE